MEYFFGKDGSRRLKHDKFVQFLRDLHEEVRGALTFSSSFSSSGSMLILVVDDGLTYLGVLNLCLLLLLLL